MDKKESKQARKKRLAAEAAATASAASAAPSDAPAADADAADADGAAAAEISAPSVDQPDSVDSDAQAHEEQADVAHEAPTDAAPAEDGAAESEAPAEAAAAAAETDATSSHAEVAADADAAVAAPHDATEQSQQEQVSQTEQPLSAAVPVVAPTAATAPATAAPAAAPVEATSSVASEHVDTSDPASLLRSFSPVTPAAPAHSTVELVDWKIAEDKNGGQYIIFLFELFYRYPADTLREMHRAHTENIAKLCGTASDPAVAAAANTTFPASVTVVAGKRFAELHAFHGLLERNFVCLPPFPSKTLTRSTEKEFVEARCAALQFYLSQLLLREDVQKTGWMQKFMGVPSPAQQLRLARTKLQQQLRESERQKRAAQQDQALPATRARAPSSAAAASHAGPTGRRFDSALEDADGVEVESHGIPASIPSVANFAAMLDHADHEELDEGDEPHVGSESSSFQDQDQLHQAQAQHHAQVHAQGAHLAPGPSASASAHDSALLEEMEMDSEDEFDRALNGHEDESERRRRAKDGSRVQNEVRRSGAAGPASGPGFGFGAAGSSGHSTVSLSDGSAGASSVVPSSVSLEFISRSPVFNMLRCIMVDANTLLACAADQSVVAKAESFFSSLFGRRPPEARREESATFTSSSSSAEISNPRGALYAFRRVGSEVSGAPDEFVQTLQVFFPYELTALEWDEDRRWIYVCDSKGAVSIFNPSPDFDFAMKLVHVPIFSAQAPVTHCKFAPSLSGGSLLLASAVDVGSRQLLARFDLNAQSIVHGCSAQFNVPRTANALEQLLALEWDPVHTRLFVASSGRVISIYDLDAPPSAGSVAPVSSGVVAPQPPALLHRLLNGHDGAVHCLALEPPPRGSGMLASGGADGVVVLWHVGPKGAERTTTIWGKLRAHHSRVTALCWSGSPSGAHHSTAAAAAAAALLVSADASGHVCVWDPRRRGCIFAFRAHTAAVLSVQLSPSRALVTASEDKSAKLWQME